MGHEVLRAHLCPCGLQAMWGGDAILYMRERRLRVAGGLAWGHTLTEDSLSLGHAGDSGVAAVLASRP